MNMPYRLVALDVDGTLLNDDHELTAGTKEAVREAHLAGAAIVLCTGRGPSNTLYLLEELGLKGILITHNGAVTVRSEDRAVVHSFTFDMTDVRSLLQYCRQRGIHYDTNTVFDMYVDRITEREQEMYGKFGIHPIRVQDIGVLEEPMLKFTMFGESESMDRIEADWADIGCKLSLIRSGDQFIDVMSPEASKGNALRELAKSLQIPREQILAIGNYYNDIDMIRFAGLGIAMDNSPEAVKAASDETTLSNNEEGVRTALRKHILRPASKDR